MIKSNLNSTPRPAAPRTGRVSPQFTADIVHFPAPRPQVDGAEPALTPADIDLALKQQRLVMHYQPQYDLNTGQTTAAEALARIQGPDGQLIYPDRFIEQAETSHLSAAFGRAVIETVCADLADCRDRGISLPRVAINLAAHQLGDDLELADFVARTLGRFGLHHDDLEFELTERQELTPCGRRTLLALARLGTRIVLDDICTGYASVQHLSDLPVSAFKLDRAMVRRVTHEPAVQTIVEALLGVADQLDMTVVAEGIESRQQAELLASYGCHHGQGFDYARPMALDQLQEFVGGSAATLRYAVN